MKDIKKYLKYIGNVLAFLSVIFVLYAVGQMKVDITSVQKWNRIVLMGLLGCFICVISIGFLALAWQRILEYLSDQKIEYRTVYKIYVKANLGKYIPGNVMHYVERNVFAGQIGLGQTEVALTSVLEIIGLIISATILSVVLSLEKLIVILRSIFSVKYAGIFIIILIIGIIVTIVGLKRVTKIRILMDKMKKLGFWRMFLVNIGIYMLALLLLASIMIMLVWSIGQENYQVNDVKIIVAAYIVAWLLGFIVPGAPGGIGVREFVISIITEGTSLESVILLAAVVQRIVTVIGDAVSYISGKMVGEKSK